MGCFVSVVVFLSCCFSFNHVFAKRLECFGRSCWYSEALPHLNDTLPSMNILRLERIRFQHERDQLKLIEFINHFNLTELTMTNCKFYDNKIPNVSKLGRLKKLSVVNSSIVSLQTNEFSRNVNLRKVDLSSNQINTLPQYVFGIRSSIEVLILSNNLISKVQREMFTGIGNLIKLDLSMNKMQSLPGDLVFKDLISIQDLTLSRNRIVNIEGACFYGLNHLRRLDLSNNRLSIVRKVWVYLSRALSELNLARNRIVTIEPSAWGEVQGSAGVNEKLDLSDNLLDTLNAQQFHGLTRLKQLNLARNKLISIYPDTFKPLVSLQKLDMSGNNISHWIENELYPLQYLNRLKSLTIQAINLKVLNTNALATLNSIEHVDLTSNPIVSILPHSIPHRISDIQLNTASLLCDCKLKWFIEWSHNHHRILEGVPKCKYPFGLDDVSVLEVDYKHLFCDQKQHQPPQIQLQSDAILTKIQTHTVTIQCVASGTDVTSVTWLHDSFPIMYTDRNLIGTISTVANGNNIETNLTIEKATFAHTGSYQCSFASHFGVVYSRKIELEICEPPVIYKKLNYYPTKLLKITGQSADLYCRTTGRPSPRLKWDYFRSAGGPPAISPSAEERRFQPVRSTGEPVLFTIVELGKLDSGVYQCAVDNKVGIASLNYTLRVLDGSHLVDRNRTVTIGEDYCVQCPFISSQVTIEWQVDGRPIDDFVDMYETFNDRLLVYNVTSDLTVSCRSGVADYVSFKLTAQHPLRVTTVDHKSSVSLFNPLDSASTVGVLTIAVVICIVVTSGVWVGAILYARQKTKAKTRRRQAISGSSCRRYSDRSKSIDRHNKLRQKSIRRSVSVSNLDTFAQLKACHDLPVHLYENDHYSSTLNSLLSTLTRGQDKKECFRCKNDNRFNESLSEVDDYAQCQSQECNSCSVSEPKTVSTNCEIESIVQV